ncbi:MAG: AMP-binding protein [Novosphingobium sp.]|nr:AMP-binding protein [Novosphingobium sp.]MCP5388202.1 AMP-binding protein [Novosphingobium sp.]
MWLRDVAPEDVTLCALLEQRAADAPEQTFFTWEDSSFTLSGFNASVNAMARNLVAAGIAARQAVAVIMETSVDYLCLWFALAKIGAVEVPVNSAYRGDLLAHALKTSGATACIVDGAFLQNLNEVLDQVSDIATVFVRADATQTPMAPGMLNFANLTRPADETNPGNAPGYCDTVGIIFTSGTTGPSKGVLLSHHYLAAYGYMYAEINGLQADDVILNYLPFFHIGAKFLTIATLVCGGRMHLEQRLSVSGFWDTVRRFGVTNFVAVGGVCNMLLGRPPQAGDRNTPIRTIYAVPDPADIHQEIENRFDCRLTTVFGSTEVGLPLFRSTDDDYRPGSCGRTSPYYEVAILDDHDQPLPAGEIGEIAVRPKRAFLTGSGYVNMAAKTVESWRNLWLHSGDRGYFDADGWYYFVDRATDSIRRRGENISSYEVEQLVGKHPAIAEVAAVAAPSELGEEEVWVQVILRDGQQLSAEELLCHCGEIMPYFMIPRFIEIVADFPRTPTAKVAKYKLRQSGPGKGAWDCQANGWTISRRGLVRNRGG